MKLTKPLYLKTKDLVVSIMNLNTLEAVSDTSIDVRVGEMSHTQLAIAPDRFVSGHIGKRAGWKSFKDMKNEIRLL